MEIDIKATNEAVKEAVSKAVKSVDTQAASRAIRASNELRNAALRVLRNNPKRTGKVYRKPHTKKAKYTASAPGEPPALRSGMLRMSWSIRAAGNNDGTITSSIFTDLKYAPMLEEGTPKMKPRPYEERIVDESKPKVTAIFSEPYLNK